VTGTGLVHLRGAKGLTELKLDQTGVTDAGLVGLKDWDHLRSLTLPQHVTDAGLLHLAKLTKLERINLTSLTGVNGPGLAGLKNATALTELDLTNSAVTDAGLEGIKDWGHLRVLKLPKGTTDAGLAHLTGLKALTVLQAWDAEGITDTGLARLKGLGNLENLDLGGTRISDAGLQTIEGLGKLRYLGVGRTRVTEPAVQALRRKFPNLNVGRF